MLFFVDVLVCFDTLLCWGLCLHCSFVLGVSCFTCYFTGLLIVLLLHWRSGLLFVFSDWLAGLVD